MPFKVEYLDQHLVQNLRDTGLQASKFVCDECMEVETLSTAATNVSLFHDFGEEYRVYTDASTVVNEAGIISEAGTACAYIDTIGNCGAAIIY
mmetsp:Transcript_15678/g.11405  ORF Transcript_15678/g.11405 Transcript_15678/m.11405 type:complete len:93 (-) Transcript_15678:2575-2853(-)|eukprot:CAMPEP_0202963684 /NCGR_PEP_ID=MMETSP1396-20130829/7690_1 /ASSEMBLY_ACC=CAM_ASM_000872 /TAXON_ID= /ORGANISM="Pseudokeronopsis sp., Strain Brazil" /LENGTH=92 /DNA_ID=CAMNT_0049685105 /DNA_START=3097 /DNA_END=3375 /DNA_ORIENTATION=-